MDKKERRKEEKKKKIILCVDDTSLYVKKQACFVGVHFIFLICSCELELNT